MINYKVGDWVETCQMMPGIVQEIDIDQDNVKIFYPHYKEKLHDYVGGSCCSIKHCGVHKIDESLANMMLYIGEERLTRLWQFLKRNVKIVSIENEIEWYKNVVKEKEMLSPIAIKNYRSNIYSNFEKGKIVYKRELSHFQDSLKKSENNLIEAWKKHDELYHQTICDLYNGVITNITQGIWLSYKKIDTKKLKEFQRLITISTGEKFLTEKKNGRYKIIEKCMDGHVLNETPKEFYERNKNVLVMIDFIKEIKSLSLEDCITYEKLIKERIKELGGGKLTEMLNILRPYYGDNKMILCQTYKDDEAPYDTHKLSFYECDDDYFNSIPDDCNEIIEFFDDYCENYYHDCKDLYPGDGMVTYVSMDGNITYEKID